MLELYYNLFKQFCDTDKYEMDTDSLYLVYRKSNITSHPRLSTANQNQVLCHPSRQPIRIEYYVTQVVSQSEASTRVVITSPESSRLGVGTLLGSRLLSARYRLS